jgi:uncharacterized membrane protein
MWKRLSSPRRTFVSGLLLILPLVITIWLIGFIFRLLDGLGVSTLIEAVAGRKIPGLGTAITIAVIYLIGLAAGSIVGARILRAVETVFLRLPFVRSIYGPARQLFSVLGRDQGSSQEVVLVEYPRKGLYMMGFVTDRDVRSVSVFLPTTPNPTSGFLVLCDPGEVTPLAVTFPEAMNFIVLGGVVKPGQPLFPGNAASPAFPDPGAKIEAGS